MKNLAIEFSKVLKHWLTAEQLFEITTLNQKPEYQNGSCASHNYCDPNQAMIDAFEALYKRQPDVQNINDVVLIEVAWDLARYHDFNPTKIKFPLLSTITKESPGTVIDSNWFDIMEEEGSELLVKELQVITALSTNDEILAEYEGYTVEELFETY